MKICYISKRFSGESSNTIRIANGILEEYAAQGFDLTLRQLYYQFVSRGIIPNKDTEYKKLGSVINDARLGGLVNWDHIVDRTRNLQILPHWKSPQEIVRSCAEQFRLDKWKDQDNYVEVWVEKDALIGVLQTVCDPLDVPYFSCRGYTSQSEMWAAAMRMVKAMNDGKTGVCIVHLGDHDPSGIDMSRDIEDRINTFITHHCMSTDGFRVNRIALNMDQIREYGPPPNPAKITDSRSSAYIDKYGNESWELDALEPSVLTSMIRSTVLSLRNNDRWVKSVEEENSHRKALLKVASGIK